MKIQTPTAVDLFLKFIGFVRNVIIVSLLVQFKVLTNAIESKAGIHRGSQILWRSNLMTSGKENIQSIHPNHNIINIEGIRNTIHPKVFTCVDDSNNVSSLLLIWICKRAWKLIVDIMIFTVLEGYLSHKRCRKWISAPFQQNNEWNESTILTNYRDGWICRVKSNGLRIDDNRYNDSRQVKHSE